jgi:hypothetical protein
MWPCPSKKTGTKKIPSPTSNTHPRGSLKEVKNREELKTAKSKKSKKSKKEEKGEEENI